MKRRATALVIQNGLLLLVRERRSREYSLLGGGIERRDRYASHRAVIRELREETQLETENPKFLFHHMTPFQRHSVYLIDHVEGYVSLQRSELAHHIWWENWEKQIRGNDELSIKLRRSTKAILRRYTAGVRPANKRGFLWKLFGGR